MNRILTIIFVILLFITAEAGFLLVLNQQSKFNQSIKTYIQGNKNSNFKNSINNDNNNQTNQYNSKKVGIIKSKILNDVEDISSGYLKYLKIEEIPDSKDIYLTFIR